MWCGATTTCAHRSQLSKRISSSAAQDALQRGRLTMADDDQPVKVRDAQDLVFVCFVIFVGWVWKQQQKHARNMPTCLIFCHPLSYTRSALEEVHGALVCMASVGNACVHVKYSCTAPTLYERLRAMPIFRRDLSVPFLPHARNFDAQALAWLTRLLNCHPQKE